MNSCHHFVLETLANKKSHFIVVTKLLTLYHTCLNALWTNCLFFGPSDTILVVAGKYYIWLIYALFSYVVLQALFDPSYACIIVLVLHIPICWVLVFELGLRQNGAALSIGISYWLTIILLILYTKYSTACQKTKIALRSNVLRSNKEFFFLAFPSTLMLCLHLYVVASLYFNISEWWSLELLVMLVGLLPNPKLETSVLLIWYVSNELGAEKPQVARKAICSILVLAVTNAIIFNFVLFFFCHVLRFAFRNDMEVVIPLHCLSINVDDSLRVLCVDVDRTTANLVAYYAMGIPMVLLYGFGINLNGRGLWIGILTGCTLQTIRLSLLTTFTNWEKQVLTAMLNLPLVLCYGFPKIISLAVERLSVLYDIIF
ncbi:Protein DETOXIFICATION 14, partial [Mucuna pruriens]